MEGAMADSEEKMQKAIHSLTDTFAAIRTGRASAALFDKVRVDCYGQKSPLNQVATIAIPEARAVVHTHSMYCTVLACLHEPIRAVHYVVADAGAPEVPCAPYRTFGTIELAKAAKESIGESDAVLLANHGMLAVGKDLASAFGLARGMEFCAEVQYRAMCAGKPFVLPDDEMERVIEKFKNYGQVKNG